MTAIDATCVCAMGHCRLAPRRFIGLRGRASGAVRAWYACTRHTQLISEMVRALWLKWDTDGVMTFEERELP